MPEFSRSWAAAGAGRPEGIVLGTDPKGIAVPAAAGDGGAGLRPAGAGGVQGREDALHVGSGKVRELYALDDARLALVASDRISTFDVVLPTEIPDKGRVLTGLSAFWFARTRHICGNHLLALADDGRMTICRRLEMLPIECVVRGYLAGSGWKDYRGARSVSGHALPEGLVASERLPEPIFTPATKAVSGHDENITRDQAAELVGSERFAEVERVSLALYRFAAEHAAARGSSSRTRSSSSGSTPTSG